MLPFAKIISLYAMRPNVDKEGEVIGPTIIHKIN